MTKAERRGQRDLQAVKGKRYKGMPFKLLIVGTSTIIYEEDQRIFSEQEVRFGIKASR